MSQETAAVDGQNAIPDATLDLIVEPPSWVKLFERYVDPEATLQERWLINLRAVMAVFDVDAVPESAAAIAAVHPSNDAGLADLRAQGAPSDRGPNPHLAPWPAACDMRKSSVDPNAQSQDLHAVFEVSMDHVAVALSASRYPGPPYAVMARMADPGDIGLATCLGVAANRDADPTLLTKAMARAVAGLDGHMTGDAGLAPLLAAAIADHPNATTETRAALPTVIDDWAAEANWLVGNQKKYGDSLDLHRTLSMLADLPREREAADRPAPTLHDPSCADDAPKRRRPWAGASRRSEPTPTSPSHEHAPDPWAGADGPLPHTELSDIAIQVLRDPNDLGEDLGKSADLG